MNAPKTYTTHTIQEGDDVILPLPEEMLEELGWKEGDTLEWKDNNDGSFSLSKKKDTQYVLVETVMSYRMRYMVEVPAGKALWALDTVACEEAKEFSQQYLGEHITSHRIVSRDEVIGLCNEDNDYAVAWDDEKKFEVFTTKISD